MTTKDNQLQEAEFEIIASNNTKHRFSIAEYFWQYSLIQGSIDELDYTRVEVNKIFEDGYELFAEFPNIVRVGDVSEGVTLSLPEIPISRCPKCGYGEITRKPTYTELTASLLSAQAEIARLREALKYSLEVQEFAKTVHNGAQERILGEQMEPKLEAMTREALSTESPSTALQEYTSQVIEECAKIAETLCEDCVTREVVADAIRELKS